MFHMSPRFWLDDQLLAIVEPEAFELLPDPAAPAVVLAPYAADDDGLAYRIARNGAPSAARLRRRHPGVEFTIRHPDEPGRTFRTFEEATSHAIESAVTTAWRVTLDVVALNRAGARWWGGGPGLAAYDQEPEATALERFIVTAESQGRVL